MTIMAEALNASRDYTTMTFLLNGQVYEWIPCESWTCQRPHTVLQTGPALASFHWVEQPEP